MTKDRALKQIISQQRETIKALKEQGEKCNIYIESLEAKIEAANKILAEQPNHIIIKERGYFYDGLVVDLWLDKLKACLSQEPLLCDKSREPPCHLEPSKELCQKCELNKTSLANGLTSEGKKDE